MVEAIQSLIFFFDLLPIQIKAGILMTPEQEQILKNILETLKRIEQRLESDDSNRYVVDGNNVEVKWLDSSTTKQCPHCLGKGMVAVTRFNIPYSSFGDPVQHVRCSMCDGLGWIKE